MYQQASPMGDHWHLSGTFLKPLRAWDYPNNSTFCPQKAMLAGMISLLFMIAFTVYTEANASCFPKPHPYTFLLFQYKH